MYAVVETGGKQYRVEVGTELEVERLDGEPGAAVTLDRVLLVADGDEASIGRPLVGDAIVSAEVVRQARGEKLIAFKYRPKARRRVKKGHRQELTVLRVVDVRLGDRSAAEEVRRAEDAQLSERQRLEAAAARQAAADQELAARLAAQVPATPAKPARGKGRAPKSAPDASDAAAEPSSPVTEAPRRGRRTAPAADDMTAEAGAGSETHVEGARAADGSADETPAEVETGESPETPHRAARPKKES